jgi:hypothetical protein
VAIVATLAGEAVSLAALSLFITTIIVWSAITAERDGLRKYAARILARYAARVR